MLKFYWAAINFAWKVEIKMAELCKVEDIPAKSSVLAPLSVTIVDIWGLGGGWHKDVTGWLYNTLVNGCPRGTLMVTERYDLPGVLLTEAKVQCNEL